MFYGKLPIIILSEIASSKSDSMNGHIAAYILSHLKEIKNDTIRELAGKMNVSTSSISRFCRDIGLSDYSELKRLAMDTKMNFEIYSFSDTALQRKDDYISAVEESLEQVRSSIDMNTVRKLCKDIRRYEKIAVFGLLKAEGVALNLQTDLILQGKHVVTKLPFSEQIDYLENADEHCLVIIFSYTGIYFDYGLPKSFKKPRGLRPKVYFITSDPTAKDKGYFDEVIWFNSRQNQVSHPFQLQMVGSLIAQRYAHLLLEEQEVVEQTIKQ